MIRTIQFQDATYPEFQAEGFAAQYAFPFANKILKGRGVDVGPMKKEWSLPATEDRKVILVEPQLNGFHANHFQGECVDLDFIFSSHCLEHVPHWVDTLDYWHSRLKVGGVVFLYLPDFSQKYWRPFNNRKHIHSFTPEIIGSYFKDQSKKWTNVFVSGIDLNNSFMLIAEKVI